jgi:hypothetical protein
VLTPLPQGLRIWEIVMGVDISPAGGKSRWESDFGMVKKNCFLEKNYILETYCRKVSLEQIHKKNCLSAWTDFYLYCYRLAIFYFYNSTTEKDTTISGLKV